MILADLPDHRHICPVTIFLSIAIADGAIAILTSPPSLALNGVGGCQSRIEEILATYQYCDVLVINQRQYRLVQYDHLSCKR
jgi:hypothetical protein